MESYGHLSSERSIKHYSNFHKILLVGEGDFSFSLTLANAFGSAENMVTTSLDRKEELLQLYKSAHETLLNLEKLGAMVLHGVNARKMQKHNIIRKMLFHRIIFNFPHAGFHGQEHDERVLKKHRRLLKMFFKNASTLLSEIGEIHVTHKNNGPYKKWELVKQAEDCGLNLKESVHFTLKDYPGYTNRKGSGKNAGRTFFLGECRTYKFVLGPGLLYQRKLMAMQVVLSNFSFDDSAENFETAILKSESERQQKMAGEMRKGDSLETLINRLEMLLNEEINTSDEFAREMTETLHQMAQAWRVKTKITEKLDEALHAINEKDKSLTNAIMELDSETRTRKAAETEKGNLKKSFNSLKKNFSKELNKNAQLKRERDEAFLQTEVAETEKANLKKSLNSLEVNLNKELNKYAQLKRERDEAFLQIEAAETEKVDLQKSLNYLKVVSSKELQRIYELEKQRDAAILQGEKYRTEKTRIARQLDEALAKDAAKKKDSGRATCAAGFVFFILFIIYFCR